MPCIHTASDGSTLDFWQKRTERQLTLEDARQITVNVSGFLSILREWQLQSNLKERGAMASLTSSKGE